MYAFMSAVIPVSYVYVSQGMGLMSDASCELGEMQSQLRDAVMHSGRRLELAFHPVDRPC